MWPVEITACNHYLLSLKMGGMLTCIPIPFFKLKASYLKQMLLTNMFVLYFNGNFYVKSSISNMYLGSK